jgi:hypothetical protein
MAVNGLAPGITVRQILQKISKELRLPLGRTADAATILKAIANLPSENPFYVIIHNIEGPGSSLTSSFCSVPRKHCTYRVFATFNLDYLSPYKIRLYIYIFFLLLTLGILEFRVTATGSASKPERAGRMLLHSFNRIHRPH